MALTNYHVTSHLLRENAGDGASTFCRRLHNLVTKTYKHKRASKLKYRENQKHCVSHFMQEIHTDDAQLVMPTVKTVRHITYHYFVDPPVKARTRAASVVLVVLPTELNELDLKVLGMDRNIEAESL